MAYHPLLNALVAPAQQLGQQRPQGVGIPRPLPGQIRFGSVAPGLAQNSAFSGARVMAPGSPLQPTPAPPGFTQAAQMAGPTASSLAPFMQTPQGGGPTLPIPGAGEGTGGAVPSPYHPGFGPTSSTLGTGLGSPIQAPPGYTGTALGTQITPPPPYNAAGTGIGTGLQPANQTLSTLLSALAQVGAKPTGGGTTLRYA